MLVIHPDECIDCSVCEPECPVNAIKAEHRNLGLRNGCQPNAEYAKISAEYCWPKRRRQLIGRSGMESPTNSNIFRPSPEQGIDRK